MRIYLTIGGILLFASLVRAEPPQPLKDPYPLAATAYQISANRVQQDDIEIARLKLRVSQLEQACTQWKEEKKDAVHKDGDMQRVPEPDKRLNTPE